MADITADAQGRVSDLLSRYEARSSADERTHSGSWKAEKRKAWYRDCKTLCNLLTDNPPAPTANTDLRDALTEDEKQEEERRGSEENLERVHNALVGIEDELKAKEAAKASAATRASLASKPHSQDGSHRDLAAARLEFCDLRHVPRDDAIAVLKELLHRVKASSDTLTPVGFVADGDMMSSEQVQEFTKIGVFFAANSKIEKETVIVWMLSSQPDASASREKPEET